MMKISVSKAKFMCLAMNIRRFLLFSAKPVRDIQSEAVLTTPRLIMLSINACIDIWKIVC